MRAYTLSVLTQLADTGHPIIEKEIIEWANNKLNTGGKTSRIKNFQDPALADSKIVLDLIDSIKPGTVNYDILTSGEDDEVSTKNLAFGDHKPAICLFSF